MSDPWPERLYSLVADESVVRPESFANTALLQEAVVNILRKYADAFYRTNRERWDSNHMVYKTSIRATSTSVSIELLSGSASPADTWWPSSGPRVN